MCWSWGHLSQHVKKNCKWVSVYYTYSRNTWRMTRKNRGKVQNNVSVKDFSWVVFEGNVHLSGFFSTNVWRMKIAIMGKLQALVFHRLSCRDSWISYYVHITCVMSAMYKKGFFCNNFFHLIFRTNLYRVFYVLLTVHPCIVCFKLSQLGSHYFLVFLFQLLYMFRATMCPSSGELTVSMRHWYFSLCLGGCLICWTIS